MNIHLNNYEAYFLDYHEGSLSRALVKELMEFLSRHPELREEFESFEPITLKDAETIKYDEKETLKKQFTGINTNNFEEYAIEYIEGTLPAALQNELKTFITQNPHYQKELELYAKTKLTPDTSIVFEDKFSLKRKNRKPAAWYYWSAAASVALIIGFYFLLNKNGTPNENTIVNHNRINDSGAVANHIAKSIDTATVMPKVAPNSPMHNVVKNIPVIAVNKHFTKQHKNSKFIPVNLQKDSFAVAINKGTNTNNVAPVKKQNTVPTHSGNDSLASTNVNDDNWHVIERPKKKKKGKLLILLATLTCKGLHKVTGQRIELEKHYNSDTTNIVAYQLDLGNKTFNFPVKE